MYYLSLISQFFNPSSINNPNTYDQETSNQTKPLVPVPVNKELSLDIIFQIIKQLLIKGEYKTIGNVKQLNKKINRMVDFKDEKFLQNLMNDIKIDFSIKKQMAIRWAIQKGNAAFVQILLKKKEVEPNVANNTPFIIACELGHFQTVKNLLEDGRVNPADQNNLAIKRAAYCGRTNIVKLLVNDSRVDPLANHYCAENLAKANKHGDIVYILREERKKKYPFIFK